MIKPNPLNNKGAMYSSNVKIFETRIMRYKDFTFPYNPQSISVSEESRIAEYNYLHTNGIEISKVRGRKTIQLEGILVADQLASFRTGATSPNSARLTYNPAGYGVSNGGEAPGVSYTEAQKIRVKLEKLADGVAGVLVLPGLGIYNTVILLDWSFKESGDYQRQYDYSLKFVVHNQVPPVTRIPQALQKTQEQLPDTEKSNVAYTIKSGDTLGAIAARYGMSLNQLKAMNPQMTDAKHKGGNLIFPGEQLRLQKNTALTEKPVGGKKTTTTKKTNIVPRAKQAATYIAAKDKGIIKHYPEPVNSAGLVVNGSGLMISGITNFNVVQVIGGIGQIRTGVNTLDKYNAAKGKPTNTSTQTFPAFGSLVATGGQSKLDTKSILFVDDKKKPIN